MIHLINSFNSSNFSKFKFLCMLNFYTFLVYFYVYKRCFLYLTLTLCKRLNQLLLQQINLVLNDVKNAIKKLLYEQWKTTIQLLQQLNRKWRFLREICDHFRIFLNAGNLKSRARLACPLVALRWFASVCGTIQKRGRKEIPWLIAR